MRLTTIHLLFFAAFLFAACSQNDPQPTVEKSSTATAQPFTAPFLPCGCTPDSAEYIRGVFNGARMCFSGSFSAHNIFDNCNFYRPEIQDQINISRLDKSGRLYCQFFLINSDVFKRPLPYIMPHTNLAYCEHVEITMLDNAQPYIGNNKCIGCDDDAYNYFGVTSSATNPNGFYMTVSDTTRGFLKGTFYGRAFTKTGKALTVTNGSFNIRIAKLSSW